MIVQWCMKGMALDSDDAAEDLIDASQGILCNWWRDVGTIRPNEVRVKLTDGNINLHVNHFTLIDPATKRKFCELTPFISLTAGTVERDTVAKTKYTAPGARHSALVRHEFRPIRSCLPLYVLGGSRAAGGGRDRRGSRRGARSQHLPPVLAIPDRRRDDREGINSR